MNILIMGPAGSGKGTMSEKIVEHFGIAHISTGDMLRAAIKNKEPYGLEAKKLMDEGLLVPDDLINKIVKARLEKSDVSEGFLADGYPRTLLQAQTFDIILDELGKKVDLVIDLTIDFKELAKRITGRRLCPTCGSIYHVDFHPTSVEGICDNCNATLIQRSDDTVEQLTVRLDEHTKNATPVLAYYEAKGLVQHVDASRTIDEIFAEIKCLIEGAK